LVFGSRSEPGNVPNLYRVPQRKISDLPVVRFLYLLLFLKNCANYGLSLEPEPETFPNSEPEPQYTTTLVFWSLFPPGKKIRYCYFLRYHSLTFSRLRKSIYHVVICSCRQRRRKEANLCQHPFILSCVWGRRKEELKCLLLICPD
jgi:hypothetical protein